MSRKAVENWRTVFKAKSSKVCKIEIDLVVTKKYCEEEGRTTIHDR